MIKPFLLSKKEPQKKEFKELTIEEQKSLWGGNASNPCEARGDDFCGNFNEGDGGTCEEYICWTDSNTLEEECVYTQVLD